MDPCRLISLVDGNGDGVYSGHLDALNTELNPICHLLASLGAHHILHVTYLLTYLLTPWSRVLLQKLTGSAASQEIPRLFGTRMFLTVPTSARHLSLS